MNIRGNTDAGAAAGASALKHLTTDFPESPTGTDTKSVAIASALSEFLHHAETETETFNASVDTLRSGLVAAPKAVQQTDAAGAATVAESGGVYI
jgi:hypothetical protein